MAIKNSERDWYDSNPYFRALHTRSSNDIERLLAEKVDVNSKGIYGWTVMHLLASWFDSDEPGPSSEYAREMILFFLKRGADVNLQDEQGDTPMHIAANYNNKTLPVFLSHAGNANIRNHEGKTPLHVAAVSGFSCSQSEPYTRLLVEAGAEVDAVDNQGFTALELLLRDGDLSQSYLPHAISLVYFLRSGADLNRVRPELRDKLSVFAQTNAEVRLAMAEAGILDWQQIMNGKTWLHLSVLDMNEKLFNRLFKTFKGNVNHKDRQNRTPLILAAGKGSSEMVKALLAGGANTADKDEFGGTALHAAAGADHLEVFKCLIAGGASQDCQNKYGQTPLELARENSGNRIVGYLAPKADKPWWKIW